MGKKHEPARVTIYEDDDAIIDILSLRLRKAGHVIVGIVRTMEGAEKRMDKLIDHGMKFAVVDGNLSPGETSGTEGALIIEALKQADGEIVTIGFSANGRVEGADHNIGKDEDGSFLKVARLIAEQHSWHR